jgi:hypothetical protein
MSPLAAVDEARVTPGVLGFLVIFALGMATWLLLRSMTRQLKRIDFEDPGQDPRPEADQDPYDGAHHDAHDDTRPDAPTGPPGEGDGPVEPTGNGNADR